MSKKVRLDVLLVDRALAVSRQKAQATIMCGLVFVNGQRVDKPGAAVRSDPRVVCLERTNARYLSRQEIPEEPDFSSVDVSFISLKLILPAIAGVLREGGQAAALIKPQFEAGREKVGKKGVVRDPAVHAEVLEHFLDHARESGFTVLDLSYSPVRGPEGNIEYLGYLVKGPGPEKPFDLQTLVEQSHSEIKE